MINIVIGVVIFSLAGYFLVKQIKGSAQGKCPSCSSESECSGNCDGNCGCS